MVKILALLLLLSTAICLIPGTALADIDSTTAKFEPPAGQEPVGNATYEVFGKYMAAQTFTAAITHDISYISIYGYVDGDPGYITLQLVNAATGNVTVAYPTRNLVYRDRSWWSDKKSEVSLDSAYFSSAGGNTTTGNGSWIDFEFPREARVEEGRIYAIVVKAPSGEIEQSYQWFYQDGVDAYAAGSSWTSSDGGTTWTGNETNDFMFETYGRSNLLIQADELYGNLTGIAVFNSFMEDGDWLVCVAYENKAPPYYNLPNIIEWKFRMQFINNDTSEVVGETVLRMWDAAPASIYLNDDEVSDQEWGGNYSISIIAQYGGMFSITEELQPSCWYGSSLNLLDTWTIGMAGWMGQENKNDSLYYLTPAGSGYVLNENGMTMFNLGIPGLGTVRGEYIYQSWVTGNGITLPYTGTPNPVLETKYNWATQLGATLVSALNDFGTPFHLTGKEVAIAIILALYVAVVGSAFPLGHGTAGSIAGFFIILIGMIAGVISPIWVLLAAAIAWIFVLRQIILVGQ